MFYARIDHVLASDHWRCVEARVGPAVRSDHWPIIAEFALREEYRDANRAELSNPAVDPPVDAASAAQPTAAE
jgi:hypothetical protein